MGKRFSVHFFVLFIFTDYLCIEFKVYDSLMNAIFVAPWMCRHRAVLALLARLARTCILTRVGIHGGVWTIIF